MESISFNAACGFLKNQQKTNKRRSYTFTNSAFLTSMALISE